MLAKTREHRNPVRGRLLDTGEYKLPKYLFTQLSFHFFSFIFFLLFLYYHSFDLVLVSPFFTSTSILYTFFLFLGRIIIIIIIIDGAMGIMN